MKYCVEESLSDFKFWGGGKTRAELLNEEQFDIIEQRLEEIACEEHWTATAINDMFWFDFDTICYWLGYKDEGYFRNGVSNDDIEEADDWADNVSADYDILFEVSGLDKSKYCLGDKAMDYDTATDDFMEWWNNLDDLEKVEEFRKYENNRIANSRR